MIYARLYKEEEKMDNPTAYLKGYVRRRYPSLRMGMVRVYSRGVYVDCTVKRDYALYTIRLLLPRNAPEEARPLCTSVKRGGVMLWSYQEDYLPMLDWQTKIRVHLFEMEGSFMLVHVEDGTPGYLMRISRLNDESFSYELEAVAKKLLARLWGLRSKLSDREKDALRRVTQAK